jgi:succinyl-diaminopimelate desuccinylase
MSPSSRVALGRIHRATHLVADYSPAVTDVFEDLPERLAARTLELVDIASESNDEAALAAHVAAVLREGGVPVRDAGDGCVVAGAAAGGAARTLLAGHLDTVPAQGNRPGRREDGWVLGLGTADMKGGLAVMIELALGGAPHGFVFFPREELPFGDSALTPLLQRDASLREARFAVVLEPTSNAVHAGCLGNVNATWTFRGRSGHSARPWLADNAIHRLARGVAELADVPATEHVFDGLAFTEVVSVTRIEGGIALNVVPDVAVAKVNYRYPPGRTGEEAEAWLRALCEPHGELVIDGHAPSGAVTVANPFVAALQAQGVEILPKQAWTPVAELALAGVDAVNLGPGDPAYAHRRDERVEIAALARCHELLRDLDG